MPVIAITGTVQASSEKHNYVKVWEEFSFKGQPKFRLWTAWFDQPHPELQEGDTVVINGHLATKVGTYQKAGEEIRNVVEHSLNDSMLQKHVAKQDTTPQALDQAPF